MKKYSTIRKIALSFILIPALFMSCEIGLGSSVDTEPPAISISNPPADAVISSEFALIGSWSDDGEIESVFVTLRNVETNVKYGAYEAEFAEPEEDEELGSWRCVISPKAAEFNIPDGNYEATVEIQDKGEHITRVIRNFAIDNTPPVIILERPGSVAGSGSMDIYGRNLTLEGMSADDHDVNLLEVYVYESDDYSNLLEKISLNNVPPTVSLPVANFEEGVDNPYSRIYKSTSILSDSAQTRYCRIVAYDGAIKYPLDGSEPTEEDKKGNSANYYFLKDTLSTSGILTDDCKITDIYKILTGNKAAPYESFMTTLNNNKVQNGAFVINPKNNPTYTVSVSQPLKKDGADFTNSTNVMYKGSPVTIEVTAGLDNYGMVNVYPYAIECDSYGNPLPGARPIPLGESTGDTPVTNYKWTAIISDDVNSAGDRLVNDHCYIVMIEGQDTIGNPVLPKDLAYGFYFDTRANVSIENLSIKINGGEDVINQRPIYLPANNPANINDASTVEVSGSVISTSGTPHIYIIVGDVQAADVTLTDAEKVPASEWDPAANNGKYKYNFTAVFNTSIIPAAYNDKELTLSVKLVNGSASKTETCKIFYDYAPPAIGVYNLTPIARKYNPATETGPCDDIEYLNQTVSFDYSVKNEGNQLAKIVSQVYKKAPGESDWEEIEAYKKEFISDFENITASDLGTIDTTAISDNSELKIALSVWDKSGNKNLKEIVYKVDQTTDEPAVLPADPEKSTLRIAKANIKLTTGEEPAANPNKKNYIETGTPLSLVAYDDDGIKKVTVKVETLSPVTKEPGNIKKYDFDVTLPTQANPYEVEVIVEDVNGRKNSYSYTFGVRVITTMPIVTLTKNKTVVSTNTAAKEKQIVATVNINSDQPDFTVERKVKLGSVEQPAYSRTFDKDYEENQSGENKKPLTLESPYITDVIDFTSALESGVYTLEYIVTDAAGKSGTATDTFKVDNKAPEIPNIQVFDPLEKKADGKYENRAQYTFKYGNSDSQKTTDGTEDWQSGINNVEYSFDNFETAPLPAAGTDGWQATVDFNSWAEGEHTIYVRATDNVGNVSTVKTANFWFDKSAPTARINSYKDKNGVTQNLNQTDGNIFYYGYKFELNITASDTNALQEVKLIQRKQGVAEPVEITIPLEDINEPVTGLPRKADGSTSDETAADGTYEYQLYVEDVCGKETLSLKQVLTVDHEPPKPAEMAWNNTNKYTPAGTSNVALKGASYQFKATAQDNGASGIKEIEYIISKIEGNPETKTEKIRKIFKADEMSNPLTLILGTSSTDANADLPEGKYEIKVKSTDNAGNSIENTGDIFYVDQKAPEVKANTYSPVGKKALTDAGNKVTITGPLTESNVLASLTVSGGKTPSITHDSTSWTITDTFTADGTDDGTKTYSITAEDIAGNKGTCTANVLIDTVAPSLNTSLIAKPETDWANNKADTEKSSFRFEGKTGNLTDGEASNSSGFKQIYFIFANENDANPENKATEAETNEQKTFTLITRDGTWSSLQSFASYPSVFASDKQGKKYLWIKAYDNAGNSNDWQKIDFIYDIAPPSISAFVNGQEQDNTKQNNNFTLTANATDSWGIDSVGLTVVGLTGNEKPVDPDDEGGKTWTIAKNQFTDDNYDFIFTAKDKAGKRSTVTRKVTIDATAPEIERVSIEETPVTGIYTSKDLNFVVTPKADVSGIKSVSYTTKDSSTRTTNDWIDMIYQSSSNNYRASVTLEEGENTVYFRIEDNAGNVSGDTDNYKKTITIDATPPSNIKIYDATGTEVTAVEIPVKGKDMTGADSLVYYLTAEDDNKIRGMAFGSNQTITEDMTPEASGIGQGKYKVEIPVTSQSTGNVYFTVTDKLGNKTNYSSFAFKVDNSVPKVTFTSPAQPQGLNGNIRIEGKVTDYLGAATGSNDGKVMTIKIEYSKDNATWVTINSTEDTITQGLTNTTESFSVEHSFSSYSNLYNSTLGKDDAATGTLYVRVTATDEAENVGSNTLTINLDRDKDRPTIVFDSVNLKIGEKTMSSSDYAWLTGTPVISGTVTDDDGVKELWIKSVDSEGTNSDWKQVTNLNKSGAWNYDIQNFYSSIADAKEKAEKANLPRILEFRVVDNQNTGAYEYFTSEELSTLHGIYIKGSDNTLLGKSGENTKLYLKVDTLDPSISIDGIHFGEIPAGETVSTVVYDSNFEDLTLGGSCRNFQIKFTAKDANGIASKQMTVTFDDGTTATLDGDIVASTVSGETDVYFASFKLDLTATGSQKAIDGKNGKLTIYLQAKDNASNDSERIKEMDYDYKKPTITINRPLENVTLSGAVTVSGILEDNTIQTPSLYYALSTSDTVSPFANEAAANADSAQPVTTWTGIDPSNNTPVNQTSTIKGKERPISIKPYYKELMSNLTWFLYLDGGATQNHDAQLNEFIQKFGIATYEEINTGDNRFDTIINLYLWIKAVDVNGNEAYVTRKIMADPQGMRPTLVVQSPESEDSANRTITGGTITINGTAEPKGTNVMKCIHVSIDNVEQNVHSTNGSTSWSTKVNAEDGDHAITVWAEDNSGNLSLKTTRYVKVDKYSPEISSIFFRQREGNATAGAITASKEYSSSAYISGQWFLEVTATDQTSGDADGNVETLKLLDSAGNEIPGTVVSDPSVNNHVATRTLKYALTAAAETNTFGELKYKIQVYDGNSTTTKDITVNYDNKKPELANPAFNINKSVVQNNGFYTFGSKVTEASNASANQSGLNFVAFFFKNGNKIYDVMRNNDSVEEKDGEYVMGADGLPWKTYSASKSDDDTITLTAAPSHIYKGGLVKINGVVYMISEVNGNDITISGTLDPEVNIETAEFALAGVVNNTIEESAPQNPTDAEKRSTNPDYFGYYPHPNNDDGDHIIEKVASDGTWQALINSKNIPDGSIDIHYVAFDKAGNYAAGSVTGATVANNQPRIAGAKIYIDYNGNGEFDDKDLHKVTGADGKVTFNTNGEITIYNSRNNAATSKSVTKKTDTKWYFDPEPADEDKETGFEKLPTTLTIGSETAAAFMMKGKTKIVPEIVGGNGEIKYSYKNNSEAMKGSNATAFMTGSTDNSVGEVTNPIVLAVGDLLKAGESTSDSPDKFTFTFTDSTPETPLTASLEIYAGVNLRNTDTPTVKIKPFYWTSLKENSLYIENLSDYEDDVTYEDIFADTKGHIELEADWNNVPAEKKTDLSSKLSDGDPKVSGIIKIEGTATDSLRIEKLYFDLPGMTLSITDKLGNAYCLSTVDKDGLIAGRAFDSTAGIGLEITKNEYTQDGHTIEWTLIWDTSKVTDMVKLDTEVKVYAQNVGTLEEAATGKGDTSADGTTSYKPIVSSAQKQNTPRSAQTVTGAETAYYKMDIVPYIQYLDTTLARKKTGHPSVYGRTASGDYPVYFYSTKFSSGSEGETYNFVGFNIPKDKIAMTVTNDSTSGALEVSFEANGDTVTTLNNVNNNAAPYNKQPNGINNNNLNDDVGVKVWNINSKAKTSSKGSLTEVKMHSNGGTLGYAYIHNGGMTYQLDNKKSNDAISTFENIDFIFDKNGNKVGVYCGTNYNGNDHAGRMKFTISNWNNKNLDRDEVRTNTIDLESMAYWSSANATTSAPRRFGTPKLASSTNTNKNNIYMLYYDTVYDELKFRAGQDVTASGNGSIINLSTGRNDTSLTKVEKKDVNTAKIVKTATSDIVYYSLAVVSGTANDDNDDKVVAVWVENNNLYYAYCENPLNDSPTWKILEVEKLSGKADGVCAIAVDPSGHIHIAAYSSEATGSLTYTYLASYDTLGAAATKVPNANTVYVDRYGTTGEFLTLEFAKNIDSGNYVPYIGYYANEMPKYAYMLGNSVTDAQGKLKAGVAGENGTGEGSFYTGNWEQVILPSISPITANDKNNNINIALTRSSGVITTTSGPADSVNPVLGYAISYQGLGYLETAQLK